MTVRQVQETMLFKAFLAVYPADQPVERPRTAAAKRAARETSGSSDDDEVSEADTDDVTN